MSKNSGHVHSSSVLFQRHVIGGVSHGLSTAYTSKKQARWPGCQLACTLIEAQERLGGVILTEPCRDFVKRQVPDSS